MNKHFKKKDIDKLDRFYRANLINSIVGIKQANLIGTISESGINNLAIFSSLIHLSSNPSLIGLFARPKTVPPKQTLNNILSTKEYTINHVNEDIINRSHATSFKFDKSSSEFDKCDLSKFRIKDFKAPFVKDSNVSIGLEYVNKYDIKENGITLIIGELKHVIIKNDHYLRENGELNLEYSNSIGVSGNNSYFNLKFNKTLGYLGSNAENLIKILKADK